MSRIGLALWLLLALPPVAAWLERNIVTQAALQIPALALAGYCIGRALPGPASRLRGWNQDGVPALLLGAGTLSLWMLPRAMDASLADSRIELAKYLSLPLAAGLPLALGWPRLGFVARAFVWANALSMLATLGWLYRVAPTRLCSYYLIDDQRRLGDVLLLLCAALGLVGLWRAFAPRPASAAAAFAGAADHSSGTVRCRDVARLALPAPRAGTRIVNATDDGSEQALRPK
jgi:hypothetical protein